MHTITEILERLESYLEDYKKTNKINEARKIGESICKIILLNSEKEDTRNLSTNTKFQVLIDSLSKNNLSENENHIKKIKTDLNVLQGLGNIESHDSDVDLNNNDLDSIKKSVRNLLINVFDSKEYIDIDEKVPVSIYRYIDKTVTENEDWRCDKVISIVYPNRKINKIAEHKDYQLYTLLDVNDKKIGFVFLGRNISFSKSFQDLFKNFHSNTIDLVSLTFLFPREISKTTGKEVKNRKKTIISKCEVFERDYPRVSFRYEFLEDYIWDYCLINSLKESSNITTEPFFVDQWLYKGETEKLSLDFLEEITTNNHHKEKPIHIILGDGGVGKTTFCTQAVQKFDQLLATGSKKKALLLSSFDLPEEISTSIESIDSIQSLYRILQDDPESTLNSQNLTLNISSGNILIIIDGLDEIESKLKEKFNLEAFIDSVIVLNETYLNGTVIITSRDNNSDKFDRDKVNIYQLKGFDDGLIKKYLEVRYGKKSQHFEKGYENKVLESVSELSLTNNQKITPLIIRLLCEMVESQANGESIKIPRASKYFCFDNALDKVIYQIINRDIIKQDINISCDDYFEILKDIVFEYNCNISKNDLDQLLEYSLIGVNKNNNKEYTNFYVSPLFQRSNDNFKIKHDTLEFWIKARYITHQIKTQQKENNNNILRLISRECYKGGSLIKEISMNSKLCQIDYFQSTIQNAINNIQLNDEVTLSRKIISAMLYLAMSNEQKSKEAYSETLLSLFNKNKEERIKYLSVFGEFFPLDFSKFIVVDGYFSGYTNLAKSWIPESEIVFIDCEFRDIDTTNFGKNVINDINFENCILSNEIKSLITSGAKTIEDQILNIKSDLKKIFKVGYKQNSFAWKSEQLYKQQCASLKHKLTLSIYLQILMDNGYINKEPAKGSSGNGYRLNTSRENIVRDFITQGLVNSELENLLDRFSQ